MALRWICLVELLRWKALKQGDNAVSEWNRMMLLVPPAPCCAAAYVCSCCLNWRARFRKNLKACIKKFRFPSSICHPFNLKCEKIEVLNCFHLTVQYGLCGFLLTEMLAFVGCNRHILFLQIGRSFFNSFFLKSKANVSSGQIHVLN